jgi:hypothetical protein
MDSIPAHPEQTTLQHGINQRVNHSPHNAVVAARSHFALDASHRARCFGAKPATGMGDFLP